jgi:hypothetical protein
MIVFIIPLKSKRVSKDWNRVSRLIERCVRSAINQTSENFRVIIVCHERPDIQIDHPSISYVQVDFPPPELGQTNVISQMDRDKNRKMWLGLEYASQFNPSYVMFVDADDCVSFHLAEFISKNPHTNGWFLDSGYVYEDGSDRIYYKKEKFYLMSGTSHIINLSLIKDESLHSVYIDSGEPLHQLVVDILASRQTPLAPLPFPGAVYIVENGENINADQTSDRSGREDRFSSFKNMILSYPRKLRAVLGSQRLSSKLADEFSISQ